MNAQLSKTEMMVLKGVVNSNYQDFKPLTSVFKKLQSHGLIKAEYDEQGLLIYATPTVEGKSFFSNL
jgi:hypothetical protein